MTPAETIRSLVESAQPADAEALAAELGRGLVVLSRKASTAAAPRMRADRDLPAGSLLTVNEAAERLGVSVSWLYRNAKDLPFTRKLGHRTLRFDARALERWAAARGGS